MRVLVNFDTKTKGILDISVATYNDNIYDESGKEQEKGLILYSSNKIVYVIKNIIKEDCDYICNELYYNGKADLTRYGSIEILKEEILKEEIFN